MFFINRTIFIYCFLIYRHLCLKFCLIQLTHFKKFWLSDILQFLDIMTFRTICTWSQRPYIFSIQNKWILHLAKTIVRLVKIGYFFGNFQLTSLIDNLVLYDHISNKIVIAIHFLISHLSPRRVQLFDWLLYTNLTKKSKTL